MFGKVLIAIARHARLIPERLLRGLFLVAADVSWLCRLSNVRQLERNLNRVLDLRHTRPDRHRLRRASRQGMRSYFTYFSEAMTVAARTPDQLRARIRGDGPGLGQLQEFTRHGGSVPLALGHQGNWDYAGYWAHDALAPVTTVAERLASPDLLETFVSIREHLGMHILLTGEHDLTERLEETLRQHHVIVPLLADRDLSHRGIFVQAFGSTIRVARGPATLALDTGLPLFVANLYREPLTGPRRKAAGTPYGYVCEINGPIDVERYIDLPREQALRSISQAWVDVWARGIIRHPEDWHMLQPVFIGDLDMARLKNVPDDLDGVQHGR